MSNPDAVKLTLFLPGEDPVGFYRDLLGTYVDLAAAEGWTVTAAGLKWPDEGRRAYDFVKAVLKKSPHAALTLEIRGPHAHTLLSGEIGVHVLKHPSTPVRIPVGMNPSDPPERRHRVYDPGRGQLLDVPSKLTTTLHAQRERSLKRILELRLCIAGLGESLGVRVWKGHRG